MLQMTDEKVQAGIPLREILNILKQKSQALPWSCWNAGYTILPSIGRHYPKSQVVPEAIHECH